MASFFNFARFGKQTAKGNPPQNSNNQPSPTNPVTASSPNSLTANAAPQLPSSPPPLSSNSLETSIATEIMQNPITNLSPAGVAPSSSSARRLPFYFREENSSLIVKGNFMTLAAKPEHVDKGEWLAHQMVEQYRLLESMIKIIQEVDSRSGQAACNQVTCPQMLAANNTIYTWLDSNKNPVRIPAPSYITLVQKWILGKINDPKTFPTDPNFGPPLASNYPGGISGSSTPTTIAAGPTNLNLPLAQLSGRDRDWMGKASGFPENFETDVKNLFRQMFRCYAHIYYAHWLEPFYHLGLHKELNTCFIHFVNVGKQFDLLSDKELLPMQPLIDIWLSKGLLPTPQSRQKHATPQPSATPQQEAVPAAA